MIILPLSLVLLAVTVSQGAHIQPVSCTIQGTVHNGHCYWFSNTADTWDNAMVRCRPGHLAEVYSADVNSLLVSMAAKHSAPSFWIGGKNDVRGTGGWMWMTSRTRMNVFQSGYNAWRTSYPRDMFSRMMPTTKCAMVKNKEWEDTQCGNHLPFACQL